MCVCVRVYGCAFWITWFRGSGHLSMSMVSAWVWCMNMSSMKHGRVQVCNECAMPLDWPTPGLLLLYPIVLLETSIHPYSSSMLPVWHTGTSSMRPWASHDRTGAGLGSRFQVPGIGVSMGVGVSFQGILFFFCLDLRQQLFCVFITASLRQNPPL